MLAPALHREAYSRHVRQPSPRPRPHCCCPHRRSVPAAQQPPPPEERGSDVAALRCQRTAVAVILHKRFRYRTLTKGAARAECLEMDALHGGGLAARV